MYFEVLGSFYLCNFDHNFPNLQLWLPPELPIRVNAMLIRDHLPELCTHLVTTLPYLQVDNLPHCVWNSAETKLHETRISWRLYKIEEWGQTSWGGTNILRGDNQNVTNWLTHIIWHTHQTECNFITLWRYKESHEFSSRSESRNYKLYLEFFQFQSIYLLPML